MAPSPRSLRDLVILCAGLLVSTGKASTEQPISYNFQVKPILAEHCLKCHGQDEKQRKAKLRLDDRDNSITMQAVVPGNPEESTLIQRLITEDEDEIMPPLKEHRPLSAEQIALLKKWVAQGAPYETHWSFIPPQSPAVPQVPPAVGHVANPIDAFVLDKVQQANRVQNPEAKKEAWLRRVTFDLTGLPPTVTDLDQFLADTSDAARGKVVDRLLNSPAYGEHMAVSWLDVARFADTYGRHEDHDCLTWPYRDWVIRSFNENLPFDKFVSWQTAGDMMPGATQDMYLATVFNRLPQQSNEAGSNEEEFRQDIVDDRIRTNGIALLGLSLECAKCHDHKYDPISQKDYYSMSAFLNNIDESGLYTVYTENVPAPSMFVYDGDDERHHADVKLKIRLKEAQCQADLSAARQRFAEWQTLSHAPTRTKPIVHLDFDRFVDEKGIPNAANPDRPGLVRLKTKLQPGHVDKAIYFRGDNSASIANVAHFSRTDAFSFSLWMKLGKSQKRAVVVHCSRAGLDAGSQGYELLLENDRPSFALCHFWPGNAMRVLAKEPLPLNTWTLVTATYDGSSRASGLRIYINGMPAEQEVVRDNLYKDITYNDAYMGKDAVDVASLTLAGRHNDTPLADTLVDEFYVWDAELTPVEVRSLAGMNPMSRPDEWFAWWQREQDPISQKLAAELKALRQEENAIAQRVKEVMVMREIPEEKRRPTYVLARGHFEARTDQVGPDTPSAVFSFPKELPRNRLGYAQWLVDRRNPLTARVFVNRVWQQFFGRGIVATSEDFGIQGQLPSHPELLDWLAVWFMDHDWNVKELCRLITLTATYGQDSLPTDHQLLKDDPDNVLLAYGPRQRLSAEQLRDNALFASGLLVSNLGGSPTKPYQPAGLWEDSGTQHIYEQDHGEALFRRSCYTFWRRTLPPPSMSIFDAPTREFCKSRRDKSTTPLQALVIFNDTQYFEAARIMAERLVGNYSSDDVARVRTAFREVTSRHPTEKEESILVQLLQDERAHFQSVPAEAEALRATNGEIPFKANLPAVEVAATTMLARALFGFEDSLMKP